MSAAPALLDSRGTLASDNTPKLTREHDDRSHILRRNLIDGWNRQQLRVPFTLYLNNSSLAKRRFTRDVAAAQADGRSMHRSRRAKGAAALHAEKSAHYSPAGSITQPLAEIVAHVGLENRAMVYALAARNSRASASSYICATGSPLQLRRSHPTRSTFRVRYEAQYFKTAPRGRVRSFMRLPTLLDEQRATGPPA